MIIIVVLMLTLIPKGEGFGAGAPFGLCLTMYPHHGINLHQTTPSPFTLQLDKVTYKPNEIITVVVKSNNGMDFKGFEMRAHRVAGNKEAILGQFTDFPIIKLKTQNCFFGTKNLITHNNDDRVMSLTMKWQAPANNVGDILFTATVVHNFTTFWHDIEAHLQAEATSVITKASYQLPKISPIFSPIDWATCGISKGCFLHPPACKGADCTSAMAYKQNLDGTYTFEMFGPSIDAAGWIGVALSKDKNMGKDLAFLCVVDNGLVEVQLTYNPETWNVQQLTEGFTNVQTSLVDGQIHCRFTREKLTRLDHNGELNFNLSETWFLFMTYGQTILPELAEAVKHESIPAISFSTVQLNDNTVHKITRTATSATTRIKPRKFPFILLLLASLLFYSL